MESTLTIREREDDNGDLERSSKRTKVEVTATADDIVLDVVSKSTTPQLVNPLPPSHALLHVTPPPMSDGFMLRIMETDVGISEYVGRNVPKIDGIIKQRFTDFLVYEVDLDSQIMHVKSLAMPESQKKAKPLERCGAASSENITGNDDMQGVEGTERQAAEGSVDVIGDHADSVEESSKLEEAVPEIAKGKSKEEPWPDRFTSVLTEFLSEEAITQLRNMFLEGPEPPLVSDTGWAGRPAKPPADDKLDVNFTSNPPDAAVEQPEKVGRGKRGRDRGGRGRGAGRGGRAGGREDNRKVSSDPISSKATRGALHQAIRELFAGKLDSEVDSSVPAPDEGSRVVIKWSKRGGGRGGRRGRHDQGGTSERAPRDTYPPYIHFTLQKTNRDTQDALAHLSRILHVNIKDLSVAGTKDKRGVTVQRVSLKRGNKTVEDVWKLANGQVGRKSLESALAQRGERGVRVADLNYRKASLELGMLKGNAFIITLRNVQVDSTETLDRAMTIMKEKGFINYYGMQRFGTASVPTHSIGLALLQSDWHKAVSLILQKRPGEHPEVVAAREAWLDDGDLEKALELMPRRVVAERCILESYQKQNGDTRNAMGALSTIPRNLRLMYVHAYQSYVWNAIVSERIRRYGSDKPVVGDLVFDTDTPDKSGEGDQDMIVDDEVPIEDGAVITEGTSSARSQKRTRKPWVAPSVKTLTEKDLDKYTIFDVIMPLPGKDVAYPGGQLGELYREFLRVDGLDPDNFVRKQKEYSLSGSYRTILHLPKELSWSILRYTDPDVPLAQADEDKLLGFDPPTIVADGKFLALQIHLTLGTAAYATMALREVTKAETSAHFQTSLTQASQDQKYRGGLEDDGEELKPEMI